jgi:aminobenzoyl-glutamate utilization protein B
MSFVSGTEEVRLDYIVNRIYKCAEGAALATETTYEIERITSIHNRIPNRTIAELVYINQESAGAPKFDKGEQEFARRLQKAYNVPEVGLDETISPIHGGNDPVSDNAKYTWFAPTCMLYVTTTPIGVTPHSWGNTASVGSSGRRL